MTANDVRHGVAALLYGMLSAASLLGAWVIGCVAHWPGSVPQASFATGVFVITFLVASYHISRIGKQQ